MKEVFTRTGVLVVCLLYFVSLGFSQTSPEELVNQILKGLERKDQQTLKNLNITEAEVKKFMWPNVASSMSGGNMNASTFASMYAKSNEIGITADLEQFGGRKWQLGQVAVDPTKKQRATDYSRLRS